MLLEGKNAVIYGGGGDVGGAVARAFAREGATVHLTGRTLEKLEPSPNRSARLVARPPSPRSTPSTSRPSTPTPTRWCASTARSTSR